MIDIPIKGDEHCVFDLLTMFRLSARITMQMKKTVNGGSMKKTMNGENMKKTVIRDSRSDEDSDDECLIKPDSDFDENNNCTVFKTTICLIMNRTVRREPSGTEEITRDSQIIYSEDVDPKDVDFVSVATHILTKVRKHFTDEHVNVRLVKGNL